MTKITIDTRAFERNNQGRTPPPGRTGFWMFDLTGPDGTTTMTARGAYRDAAREAMIEARRRNAHAVAVCP